MYMHAIYKIREFLSNEGFNLIKVISVYTIVHVYVIYCFNAELFQETSGSSGCEIILRRPL